MIVLACDNNVPVPNIRRPLAPKYRLDPSRSVELLYCKELSLPAGSAKAENISLERAETSGELEDLCNWVHT